MELIKKIKQAEQQAQEIIEQAKAGAARLAEKGREERRAAVTEAEQQRKKATEAAVAEARSEGLAEVENLKMQAEKQRQELHDKAGGRLAAAVARVMDYLSSHHRSGLSRGQACPYPRRLAKPERSSGGNSGDGFTPARDLTLSFSACPVRNEAVSSNGACPATARAFAETSTGTRLSQDGQEPQAVAKS